MPARATRRWRSGSPLAPASSGPANTGSPEGELSLALGTHGDNWPERRWKTAVDRVAHPDVQICIMNAR